MEKKGLDITLCVFDPAKPGPYEQYILPHITAEMRLEPERFAALGAAWDRCAVGAAALTEDEDDPGAAALASLFVDPQVRRRGIGTALLGASVKTAAAAGGLRRIFASSPVRNARSGGRNASGISRVRGAS